MGEELGELTLNDEEMKTLDNKIKHLDKVLQKLLLFSRHYKEVELIKSGKYLIVMWHQPKDPKWYSHELIEFPIKDIDVRTQHYSNKIKYAFKTRNKIKVL